MKIAVWGAGAVGSTLVYRLATTTFTSEIRWINRNYQRIAHHAIDLEHGLDFSPTCRRVEAYAQEDAERALDGAAILVLTLGAGVPPGGKREDLFPANGAIAHKAVVPALHGFPGLVVVVTNPVDLMARLIHREAALPSARVLGLGTLVETARLRASLGSYLSPAQPAREIWAFAVGTHDERFVPVATATLGIGAGISPALLPGILDAARREVAQGASRVKAGGLATLHPVVEGVIRLCETIAFDRHSLLTVSVLDPETPEGLFYSVPCSIGAQGLVARHTELLSAPEVAAALEACREGLRKALDDAREG